LTTEDALRFSETSVTSHPPTNRSIPEDPEPSYWCPSVSVSGAAQMYTLCSALVVMSRLVPADMLLTRGDEVRSQEMTREALGYAAAQSVQKPEKFQTTTRPSLACVDLFVSRLEPAGSGVGLAMFCRTRESVQECDSSYGYNVCGQQQ
jgi:hypothetical protein